MATPSGGARNVALVGFAARMRQGIEEPESPEPPEYLEDLPTEAEENKETNFWNGLQLGAIGPILPPPPQ